MKKLLFFLIISCLSVQNFYSQDILGKYHQSSGNPDDGGYTWYLLENNNFMMVTFGRIVSGKWKMDANKEITFTPIIPNEPFEVFGRYNPKLVVARLMFSNFDINEDSYLGINQNEMQALLNPDSNCLPYPMLKDFPVDVKQITLSNNWKEKSAKNPKSYVFETRENNDFILIYYSSSYMLKPFTGRIKNNRLEFKHDRTSSERKKIGADEKKELEEVTKIMDNPVSRDKILSNDSYNFAQFSPEQDRGKPFYDFPPIFLSDYKYDEKSGVYTAKVQQELDESEAYHNLNVLYEFKKITPKMQTTAIKIKPGSEFQITCGE